MDSRYEKCAACTAGVKITQDGREYATTHGLKGEEALTRGMEEKSREFIEKGAEVV
jgi:phosphomethylpyrimidine synthase